MSQTAQASLFPAKQPSVQGSRPLPSGWEWVPLDQVLNIQNGYAFDSNLFSIKEGFPLVRIRDLCTGEPSIFYNGVFDPKFIVKPGDCLIGMDGEFKCYRWSGPEALLNQRVCRLIDFHKNVDPAYVCHGLNQFLKRIEDDTPFVTVKHISAKQIKGIRFPFPPSLAIQRRIVARIETLLTEVKEARALAAAI
jgi:type I restriction enzyme, S subunit